MIHNIFIIQKIYNIYIYIYIIFQGFILVLLLSSVFEVSVNKVYSSYNWHSVKALWTYPMWTYVSLTKSLIYEAPHHSLLSCPCWLFCKKSHAIHNENAECRSLQVMIHLFLVKAIVTCNSRDLFFSVWTMFCICRPTAHFCKQIRAIDRAIYD